MVYISCECVLCRNESYADLTSIYWLPSTKSWCCWWVCASFMIEVRICIILIKHTHNSAQSWTKVSREVKLVFMLKPKIKPIKLRDLSDWEFIQLLLFYIDQPFRIPKTFQALKLHGTQSLAHYHPTLPTKNLIFTELKVTLHNLNHWAGGKIIMSTQTAPPPPSQHQQLHCKHHHLCAVSWEINFILFPSRNFKETDSVCSATEVSVQIPTLQKTSTLLKSQKLKTRVGFQFKENIVVPSYLGLALMPPDSTRL
jgi:hypothetical protein